MSMKRLVAILLCFVGLSSVVKAEIDDLEGYQGFIDVGYSFGTGDYGLNSVDVTTTHGVQVVPTYLFLGVGAGLQYFTEPEKCAIPMFVDARSCFLPEENVSPFVDVKIGYVGIPDKSEKLSSGGAYINPSVGCTYIVKDFVALNISLGYTFEQAKVFGLDKRKNIGGFALKFGVQF